MREVRRVTVTDAGSAITMLNELEFIDGLKPTYYTAFHVLHPMLGEIYANVFTFDCIARINPKDGVVSGWIVLDDILKRAQKWVKKHLHCVCLMVLPIRYQTRKMRTV